MAKQRLNQDEAFQSLMGIKNPASSDTPSDTKTPPENETIAQPPSLAAEGKEKYTHRSFYITEKQYKALKIRTALSNKPEDRDTSSIVRAALDMYLADTLKDL